MKSIFIVDDEETNRMVVKKALEDTYKTYALPSAAAMFKLMEKITPELILLDIMMPEMDGFAALERLKKNEETASIPVIILTSSMESASEVRGFEMGAVDYITKPFHNVVVRARVKTHIRIVEQMRTIEQFSLTDPLTGMPNRRGFDKHMERMWERAKCSKSQISALMIDVDWFKTFNDTYGHMQGDMLLQTLAKIFRQAERTELDMAARWGGEEFVVLLPDADISEAQRVAEQIRARAAALSIVTESGSKTAVTVSVGVSGGFADEVSGDELIKKADEALYRAKEAGRDKVAV